MHSHTSAHNHICMCIHILEPMWIFTNIYIHTHTHGHMDNHCISCFSVVVIKHHDQGYWNDENSISLYKARGRWSQNWLVQVKDVTKDPSSLHCHHLSLSEFWIVIVPGIVHMIASWWRQVTNFSVDLLCLVNKILPKLPIRLLSTCLWADNILHSVLTGGSQEIGHHV